MADQQDRAVEFEEVFFQPFDRGQVQVIGRFVQEQQVRLADENLRQVQLGSLPAGERFDVLLPGIGRQADAEQGRFELMPPGISAGQVELVLDVLIGFQRLVELLIGVLGHVMLELTHPMRQIMQRRERKLRFVHHGVARIEDGVLREMAELDGLGDGDDADFRRDFAGDDLE